MLFLSMCFLHIFYSCYTCMSSDPTTIHDFLATNRAHLTGRSHTSNDLTKVCVSWFHTWTLPLYKLASIQLSVGWRSQLFTLSDRAVKRRLMSSRSGWKIKMRRKDQCTSYLIQFTQSKVRYSCTKTHPNIYITHLVQPNIVCGSILDICIF